MTREERIERLKKRLARLDGQIKKRALEFNYLDVEASTGRVSGRDFILGTREAEIRGELRRLWYERDKTQQELDRLAQQGEPEAENQPSGFRASPDYRSIEFKGKQYVLTLGQAQVVQMLDESRKSGTPCLGQDYILEKLETPASRLRDTFKTSPLWRTLIVRGEKRGTYRLNLP